MKLSHLVLIKIDEAAIARFLDEHLPHCDCSPPVARERKDLHAACSHLLRVLRDRGVIPLPALPATPVDAECREFDAHMENAQGLTSETRRNRIRIVDRFLRGRFGKRAVVISALQPADVRKFIVKQLDQRGTASNAAAIASALRAYFRYRTVCGDKTHTLVGVISSPAHWSLAALPRYLTADEINRLLDAFPPSLPSHRRGYAMVRCALDMGLRTSEIARLALADIDWSNGTITLRRNKFRREDVLPMPATTVSLLETCLNFAVATVGGQQLVNR